ncbi:Glutaredoxin-C4, chloroplastic [Leucoagaricus sp. SymC.cos]|nr:Glutaredoxin-C4, chloroplastic [Leucoagaricus sp. SymC.cos]
MSFLRRTPVRLFIIVCVLLGLSWALGLSWELPETWKDTGILTSSRARIAEALKAKKQNTVDEIYGLLHLVAAESDEYQHVLNNKMQLDPTKPISLNDYTVGNEDLDWNAEAKRLDTEYPVIVFSKSYCPYSKRAKNLLATYDLHPQAKVIEVDLRDDSAALKAILTRLTQHSTFPNILVRGKSLGGSDDLQALHDAKSLAVALRKGGVVIGNKNIQ